MLSQLPPCVRGPLRSVRHVAGLFAQSLGLVERNPRIEALRAALDGSRRIVDLGCGNHPVRGATVAVDCYIEPKERGLGSGPTIDIAAMEQRGIRFVNSRIDVPLPFQDKEFDFAYSHHVFEHLDDPATACREMMRIAKRGVIITPSVFAEFIFGRPYHQWMLMDRGNTLFFFRKRPFEDRPFGDHPRWDEQAGTFVVEKNSNPFDMLLNDGGWYRGTEEMPRIANVLRKHWRERSPLVEVMFFWENEFSWVVHG